MNDVEVWIGGECHDDDCVYHFVKGDTIDSITADNGEVMITFTDGHAKIFNGLPYQVRLSSK